jgi:hypothetical protein
MNYGKGSPMGRWSKNRTDAKLRRELEALRPEARPEFVEMVAGRLHEREGSSRLGRFGIVVALTGLILVALASFGGVGYASSAASQAIKKVERIVHSKPPATKSAPRQLASSGQAQYGPFTPPPKPKPCPQARKQKSSAPASTSHTACPKDNGKGGKNGGNGNNGGSNGGGSFKPPNSQGSGSGLPFTGLDLWIPVAIGLSLFLAGLALRRAGRRRETV